MPHIKIKGLDDDVVLLWLEHPLVISMYDILENKWSQFFRFGLLIAISISLNAYLNAVTLLIAK